MKKSDSRAPRSELVNRFASDSTVLQSFNQKIENEHMNLLKTRQELEDILSSIDDTSLRKRYNQLCEHYKEAAHQQRELCHVIDLFTTFKNLIGHIFENSNVYELNTTKWDESFDFLTVFEHLLQPAIGRRELGELYESLQQAYEIYHELCKHHRLREIEWKCLFHISATFKTLERLYVEIGNEFFRRDWIVHLFFVDDCKGSCARASLQFYHQIPYDPKIVVDALSKKKLNGAARMLKGRAGSFPAILCTRKQIYTSMKNETSMTMVTSSQTGFS